MRIRKWRSGTAVALVGLTLSLSLQPAIAVSQAEIEDLKRIILEQQKRLEEQQRWMQEQEKRLLEQNERIAEQEKRLAEQDRLSQAQGLILSEHRNTLDDLWTRFEYVGDWDGLPYDLTDRGTMTLVQGVAPKAPVPIAPGETDPPSAVPPAPTPPADEPKETPTAGSGTEPSPDEDRPQSETPTDQLLVEAGGILLPPGTLQIEPGVEYTFSDNDAIGINGFSVFEAIVIGNISVDEVQRDIVRSSITARLGVYDRVQIDTFIPYIYRNDTVTDGVGTAGADDYDTNGHGIGDIQFGVSVQPVFAQGMIPDVILRTRASFPTGRDAFGIDTKTLQRDDGSTQQVLTDAPTGSGFYSRENSMTMVWASDPVVFFGGGGYRINFEDTKNGQDVNPGNSFNFFGGMNVALNESVSLNLSFTDQITEKTSVDGDRQPASQFNDGRVVLGASVGLADNINLLLATAAGVTDEAPDFQFSVSLPITMSVF